MHKDARPNQHDTVRTSFWTQQFIGFILTVMLFAGCETTQTGQTSFTPAGGSRPDLVPDGEKAQAIFSGGDGSTAEQAVVITGASGEKTGVRAEYVWLHEHYPGYRLRGQTLRNINNKAYDEMRIASADDKPHTIFFDITSFLGKWKVLNAGRTSI